MSDHPSAKEAKKAKKHALLLKNRKHQIIAQHAEQHGRERDLEREREEEMREAASRASARGAAEKKGEPTWSARMQQVRNKIDGSKRMADDRWNRFAGTESGGGMGR
jgi:hypothetical protein